MDGGKDLKSIIEKLEYPDEALVIKQVVEQQERLSANIGEIRHKITILSGKGGVGKSTVTVNMAIAFARLGYSVGVLDADLNGPCIPKMMGTAGLPFDMTTEGAIPPSGLLGIKIASMGSFVTREDRPVRWKGPVELSPVWLGAMEMSVLREFLSDVVWGDIDYLFIDLPPGAAADKPPVIAGFIPDLDGAVIVTIPSEVSIGIVKRSVVYARDLGIPILGLIENMSGIVCPECGSEADLFTGDSEAALAGLGVPLLGKIPFDRRLSLSCDRGEPLEENHIVSRKFSEISQRIVELLDFKKITAERI